MVNDPPTGNRPFLTALNDLRVRAGWPTQRTIAREVTATSIHLSHATVSDCLAGNTVPTWDRVSALVTYLGGDPAEVFPLWIAAQKTPRWMRTMSREPDGDRGYLVLDGDGGLRAVLVGDPAKAAQVGWEHRGLVLEVPVVADFRKPEASR